MARSARVTLRSVTRPRFPVRHAALAALLAAAPWTTCLDALAASAPTFQIGYQSDSELKAPLVVTFRATLPHGYRVSWTFGDGTGSVVAGAVGGGPVTLPHTYYRPGVYAVQAELLDSGDRVVSRARGEVQVKSAGAEAVALTLLLGRGTLKVSALGSVLYAPNPVQLSVNGQAVKEGQAIQLGTGGVGTGRVQVRGVARTSAGQTVSQELTFTLAPLGGSDPFEAEVLRLTNRARAQGWNCATLRTGSPALPPLKGSATLDTAALAQSAGMALAGYFDHQSKLDGSAPMRRVQAAGMRPSTAAENIAAGQETPQEVVDGWLRSPGHCRNIMGEFTLIGVSYVTRADSPYKRYWTQVFARP